MVLIGYSGHGFVAYGILKAAGKKVTAYCDTAEKTYNPFHIPYLGKETDKAALEEIMHSGFFIAIGDAGLRKKVYQGFEQQQLYPSNAIHPSAIIDESVDMYGKGIMIAAGVCINPLSKIGNAAVCNTGCIIEHECIIGDFVQVAPGAILCGNVSVGNGSFVGAGAVVRQGISIGENVMIGAGAVVVKNVGNNETVVGNPSRIMVK